MSWEVKLGGCISRERGVEGALRHPDGSPDIAAYGRIAHRERAAAIASAVMEITRSIRAMPSAIRGVLIRRGAFGRTRPSEAG
jgi:hypothetical protein